MAPRLIKLEQCCIYGKIAFSPKHKTFLWISHIFNLVQNGGGRGGGRKKPPTSFSPATSANVGITPQNFLTKFEPMPLLVKGVFLVKSLRNWGYDNFSHIHATITKLWSHDHIYNIILSYVRKLCCRHHGQKLWRHDLFFKIPLFEEGLE